ncbi:von Willebrand factor A domain-containing protein 5A-like isoform X5 [Macrobrachium rosenbergii]|uniref:von Willebrand factor A domain-containing protein 5A-like isoform X5 n=1 Tax=Macrobrachium rosenbergii TaxID=79674 RepID=UPI0034D4C6B7
MNAKIKCCNKQKQAFCTVTQSTWRELGRDRKEYRCQTSKMAPWGLIGRAQVADACEQTHNRFKPPKVHVVTLKAVDIRVTVRGFAARVDASLTYHNATDNALELEFRMPVDEGAAVYKFEAVIGGRKISAQCLEKKKAEKIYKDAVQSGHTAVLAREDALTADTFHLALGNLPGGSQAELQLSMMMELKVKTDGAVSFTLPTVLNPRYCPCDISPSQHTESVARTGNSETVIVSEAYTFGINAKVQGGHVIARIASHRESLNVELSDDSMSAEVTQDSGGFKPDHDWSMLVYYTNPYKTHIIRESGERAGTGLMKDDLVMVNLHPEFTEESYSHRNEILFVVDCSGSMHGDRIQSARATLLLFLKSLPTGCYFNVISFGSTYSLLFSDGSQEYTEETLKKALGLHSTIEADMGGTEILQPIKQIYSTPPKPGYARQIILLTDGQVFNVDQVKELVSRHAHETRVFAVGIGDGASTALVYGLARAGRGHAEMVYQQDKLQLKVMGLVRSMLQESAQDVRIIFDVDPPGGIKLIPKNPPIIFGGQHLIMYVRVPTSTEVKSITVSGVVGNAEFKNCYSGSDVVTIHDEEKTLHRLAARAQINEWQIDNEEDVVEDMITLSLATGVVCRRTALVGVDQDMKPVGHNPEALAVFTQPCSRGVSFRSMAAQAAQPTVFDSFCSGASSDSVTQEMLYQDSCLGASLFSMLKKMRKKIYFNKESPIKSRAERDADGDMGEEAESVSEGHSPVDCGKNLMSVVSLQKFDGSWTLEDAVKITSLPHLLLAGATTYKNETSWATSVVLAFLETKYSAEKDEWALLANKAQMFIARCGDDVEALMVAARKVLAEN